MDSEKLKNIIVKNLIDYRKASKLTQAELAEKINYSDKAISKWERGEGTPDIFVLQEICEIYNISINDLITEHNAPIELNKHHKKKDRFISFTTKNLITLLSFGLVWFIATIIYAGLEIFTKIDRVWLVFLYAIPVSVLVVYIFTRIWGTNWLNFIFLSFFSWSFTTCIYLTFKINMLWLLFVAMATFQVLIILWFFLKQEKFKSKQKNKIKAIADNLKQDDKTKLD